MIGSESLRQMGHLEEAEGHNAIAAGFQGQRQWTDHFPNGDFMEAILNSSFDWNGIRQPYIVATENDSLNGAAMLLGHLLTGRAQVFSDVRTYWSPEAVKRVTGYTLEGAAAGGIIHLLNSGASALDGTGEQCDDAGSPVMKQWWEIGRGCQALPRCDAVAAGQPRVLPRRRLLVQLQGQRRDACDYEPHQPHQRPRPCPADRRRVYCGPARGSPRQAERQDGSDLADLVVRTAH